MAHGRCNILEENNITLACVQPGSLLMAVYKLACRQSPWAFSIYKKIRKFSIGNFRLGKRVPFVTSPILGRPGRLIDRKRHGTGDKDNKSVNGTQIFHWEVSTGKMGLPFQEFRLFRKISSGTNQKVVFHLQPDRNFRNFLVNGKRSLCLSISIDP